MMGSQSSGYLSDLDRESFTKALNQIGRLVVMSTLSRRGELGLFDDRELARIFEVPPALIIRDQRLVPFVLLHVRNAWSQMHSRGDRGLEGLDEIQTFQTTETVVEQQPELPIGEKAPQPVSAAEGVKPASDWYQVPAEVTPPPDNGNKPAAEVEAPPKEKRTVHRGKNNPLNSQRDVPPVPVQFPYLADIREIAKQLDLAMKDNPTLCDDGLIADVPKFPKETLAERQQADTILKRESMQNRVDQLALVLRYFSTVKRSVLYNNKINSLRLVEYIRQWSQNPRITHGIVIVGAMISGIEWKLDPDYKGSIYMKIATKYVEVHTPY